MAEWIIQNYVVTTIVCGIMLLGAVTGALGVFTVIRKQALAGDALSHASLPGVVLAYAWTGSKEMVVLLIGAGISAVAAMMLMVVIKRFSKIKNDGALALILSAFFGIGQLLLRWVQNQGATSSAGLSNFIFGQAATMLQSDVYIIAGVSFAVILCIAVLWKEFKLYIFDAGLFQSMGFSRRITEVILTLLTVTVVVISIRVVGVILMSALLISPSVAARQWSNKLSINVLLSGAFCMFSGITGTLISATRANLPTGPVITVILSIVLMLSLMCSPKKGIIVSAVRASRHKKYMKDMSLLSSMFHCKIKYTASRRQNYLLKKDYAEVSGGIMAVTQEGIKAIDKLKEEGGFGI